MSSFVCNLIMSCQSCLVHVCSYIIEPHVAAKAQAIEHMAESLRSVTHTCIVVDGINNLDSSIMQIDIHRVSNKKNKMLVWCLHLCQFFFGSELAPLKNQFVFHWSWNRGRATPVYQHQCLNKARTIQRPTTTIKQAEQSACLFIFSSFLCLPQGSGQ